MTSDPYSLIRAVLARKGLLFRPLPKAAPVLGVYKAKRAKTISINQSR